MCRYTRPRASALLCIPLLLAACAPAAALPADVQVLVDQAVAQAQPTAAPVVATRAAEEQLPALPPATCAVTPPPDPVFTPPGIEVTYPAQFWYGTAALWTDLPTNGAWADLPHDDQGYGQTLFFGREGHDAYAEPALTVTGRRLDDEAAPLEALPATNGMTDEVGHFMLAGGNFPTAGCWEVTAQYGAAALTYVIWIAP